MWGKATLTDATIREISRLRLNGVPEKEAANQLGCTRRQVAHYWQKSAAFNGAIAMYRKKRATAGRARAAKAAAAMGRIKARQKAELTEAKRALRMIIEDTIANPSSTPYRSRAAWEDVA